MKPILCVDFDGVIHSYTSKWIDEKTIPDPPVPSALRWLVEASKNFKVVIYSSRSKSREGIAAMGHALQLWADQESLPDQDRFVLDAIEFAHEKPPAFLTIDDRAIQFNGDWSSLDPEKLRLFKPWNKR
jgi:hypothetical protein